MLKAEERRFKSTETTGLSNADYIQNWGNTEKFQIPTETTGLSNLKRSLYRIAGYGVSNPNGNNRPFKPDRRLACYQGPIRFKSQRIQQAFQTLLRFSNRRLSYCFKSQRIQQAFQTHRRFCQSAYRVQVSNPNGYNRPFKPDRRLACYQGPIRFKSQRKQQAFQTATWYMPTWIWQNVSNPNGNNRPFKLCPSPFCSLERL